MLILNYIPIFDKICACNLVQAHILSNFVVLGKIRIIEFHQPPLPTTFDDSPYAYDTPLISMHICETMRYSVSIDCI